MGENPILGQFLPIVLDGGNSALVIGAKTLFLMAFRSLKNCLD